jgi:hypothetical protein
MRRGGKAIETEWVIKDSMELQIFNTAELDEDLRHVVKVLSLVKVKM